MYREGWIIYTDGGEMDEKKVNFSIGMSRRRISVHQHIPRKCTKTTITLRTLTRRISKNHPAPYPRRSSPRRPRSAPHARPAIPPRVWDVCTRAWSVSWDWRPVGDGCANIDRNDDRRRFWSRMDNWSYPPPCRVCVPRVVLPFLFRREISRSAETNIRAGTTKHGRYVTHTTHILVNE